MPPFATCMLTMLVCIMDNNDFEQCEDFEEGRTTQEWSGLGSSIGNDYRVAVSILERLRAPTQSNLGRKRNIHTNSASLVRKKHLVSQARKFNPHTVQPAQRVSKFPGEQLCVGSAGRVFCQACRETLAIKRSVVQLHLKSRKHENGQYSQ